MIRFEFGLGHPAEALMAPPRVVPTLALGKQRDPRGFLGLEAPAVDEFAFQARREAIVHGVVVGTANTAHGWTHVQIQASCPNATLLYGRP